MMMSVLDKGRIGIAALAVGILAAALEDSIADAKQRRQFGQPIADFQAVQWMIADMAKDAHAARIMVHHAARVLDPGGRATLAERRHGVAEDGHDAGSAGDRHAVMIIRWR